MKTPKISVVIPAYNRPQTLRRLLKSVARQTQPASEVIVVDDASPASGKIPDLVQSFRGRLPGLQFIHNKINHGQSRCRNQGIRAARFPLIALSDDDDEWMPRKLEKQAALFRLRWNDTEMVYTWVLLKEEGGRVLWRFKPSLEAQGVRKFLWDISGSLPNPSATLIKKECLLRAGLFDESLSGPDDWDMWLRILQKGARCRAVRDFLTIQHQQKVRVSISLRGKLGFLHFARKHFLFFLRVNPVVFLHLAWFLTGVKLGLRDKFSRGGQESHASD